MTTRRRAGLLVGALWTLQLVGCAWKFEPVPLDQVSFRDRSQTQTLGNVTITAAVPSADETRKLFGANLYAKGIQPVWLRIQNASDDVLTFLPVGLDPQYYTPAESAYLGQGDDAERLNSTMTQYFYDRGMEMFIHGGDTSTGYVFTRLEEGTKAFNVDILSDGGKHHRFTFFIPVPGLKLDHEQVDWDGLYEESEIKAYDTAQLIEALEKVHCCTTDKNAKGQGDPVNLVVIGNADDVYYAFIRAGWDETETIYRGSMWKTVVSFLGGAEYRYSPVSGLYVFGRPQDVAFQKARDSINERNHLRLWLAPFTYEGKEVWMGQISRDIGVRFTKRTITTHKIDPDVDETREFLLEDLAYSQALAQFAYVGGVGEAPFDSPRGNLTGDPYFTDGYRVVLWVSGEPVDISDIQTVDWAVPPDM